MKIQTKIFATITKDIFLNKNSQKMGVAKIYKDNYCRSCTIVPYINPKSRPIHYLLQMHPVFKLILNFT